MLRWGGLPPETVTGAPRAVLYGRTRVLVEQHAGLLSFDSALVALKTGRGVLRVRGKGLRITHFGAQDTLVEGDILSVAFDEETA